MTLTSAIIRKDDREAVIGLLAQLGQANQLTPEKIVNLARADDHVLHRYFEWDDRVAGERYRKNQARQLIQSIKVNIVTAKESVVSVRAIISVPHPAGSRRYSLASALASDPEAQKRVKEAAIIEISRLRKKYADLAHLPEFAAVFEAVDSLSGRESKAQ